MAANGGLTHGAPVDGLGLVFVLGSVPHERQPFYSCQSAARDRQTEKTDRQTRERERQNKPEGGGGKENKRKRRAEQRDVVNVFTKRARGEMQRESGAPGHSTGQQTTK